MGIISPLCFITLVLLQKKKPLGTLLWAIMLRACIVVGIREVITRMLRYFQSEGLVNISRGRVTIVDEIKLQKLL